MNRSEEVLCVPRKSLPRAWLGDTAARVVSEEALRTLGAAWPLFWVARGRAEHDPTFKQIIPYGVVQRNRGLETGCYLRHGTESRLHGRWSMGVGGHVSREDHVPGEREDLLSLAGRGLAREVREELGVGVADLRPELAGIINEERSEVGRVHLGLVFRLSLGEGREVKPDAELDAFSWRTTGEIPWDRLELWSRLALCVIAEATGNVLLDGTHGASG